MLSGHSSSSFLINGSTLWWTIWAGERLLYKKRKKLSKSRKHTFFELFTISWKTYFFLFFSVFVIFNIFLCVKNDQKHTKDAFSWKPQKVAKTCVFWKNNIFWKTQKSAKNDNFFKTKLIRKKALRSRDSSPHRPPEGRLGQATLPVKNKQNETDETWQLQTKHQLPTPRMMAD